MSTPGPEFLQFTGLKADTEKREVSGLALPYGEDLDRPDFWSGAKLQRFDKGSAVVRENATLYFGHDHMSDGLPIGRITSSEDTPEGLRITARISSTPKGDEVYTLLKDGVLDRFSIGFYRVANQLEDIESDSPVLVHTEIDVFETSIVPDPAFKSAQIESVLQRITSPEGSTMPENQAVTAEQIATLSTSIDAQATSIQQLERQIATLGAGDQHGAETLLKAPMESYGEFLKAVADRDAEALSFLAQIETLAMTTTDLGGHIKDAWVGDLFRELTEKRQVINFFGVSKLPKDGMNVEYGLVKPSSNTLQVGKQANEGAVLPYGKIAFGTASAPIDTYGGWTDFSKQVIQRSGVAVVEKAFRALVRRYAQATEAAVRTTAVATASAVEVGTAAHDLATSDGWVDYAVDAATYLDERGLTLDGFLLSADMFKTLAKIRIGTNGAYFLDRDNGSVSVPGLSGEVFNVPVKIVPTAAAGTVRGASTEALDVWEDGAAPFRLQDEDITNLTEAMSIYGYLSHARTDLEGITRPNDGVA